MKRVISFPMLILLIVSLAFVTNIGRAVATDFKYDEGMPNSVQNTLQKLVQVVGLYTYTGYARSGESGANAVWQVSRYYNAGTGAVCSTMYYNGDASFNAIWNDRQSATYR
jgi:ABC-type polysaccharide transport system permease subunit